MLYPKKRLCGDKREIVNAKSWNIFVYVRTGPKATYVLMQHMFVNCRPNAYFTGESMARRVFEPVRSSGDLVGERDRLRTALGTSVACTHTRRQGIRKQQRAGVTRTPIHCCTTQYLMLDIPFLRCRNHSSQYDRNRTRCRRL